MLILDRRSTAAALASMFECRWDTPSSDMGLVPEAGGGGGGNDDRRDSGDHDDVGDGHDDDRGAGDEGDRRADARGRRDAAAGDDDDQDDDPLNALGDDDDDDQDGRPIEERFKKVVKSKRRLERTVKKNAAQLARLKELRDAGVNIDDLVHSHRELVNLQRRLEESPQLRALLAGGGDEDASRGRGGKKTAEREPVKYPFKLDNESGQFFKQFHEGFVALQDEVRTELSNLRELVTGIGRETTQARTSGAVKEWRSAAETAAKQIPEGFRDLFMHAIGSDMRRALRGEIKASAQQVIDHHLAKLKKKGAIGRDTKTRASEAARESIARRNDNFPRRPAGNGSSGPAKERRIPRLADFNRQLKAKFGGA